MDATTHLRREELVLAADRAGVVTISSPRLARIADVRQQTAWAWLHGRGCDRESEKRILQALGLYPLGAGEP